MASYARLFAKHGMRCTKQRVEVYRALLSHDGHPTADELRGWMSSGCGAGEACVEDACCVSRATVYNALEALCVAGLCRRLPLPGGACRYDGDLSEHCHVVREDGAVVDVPCDVSERLLRALPAGEVKSIERAMGVRIERLSLCLHAGEAQAGVVGDGCGDAGAGDARG